VRDEKLCAVSATDSNGVVRKVPVVARSRNEAAARAIEELSKAGEWRPDGRETLTVHEPKKSYQVSVE